MTCGGFERSADAAYQADANGKQLRGFNGFGHMHLVTEAKDTLAVLRPDKRGERHGWRRAAIISGERSYFPDQVVTIFTWHPDVAHQKIRL